MTGVYADDPNRVAGCADCLMIVAEDLQDTNEYRGRCLHCRQEITAQGGVEWRRAVRRPCLTAGGPDGEKTELAHLLDSGARRNRHHQLVSWSSPRT